MPETAPPRSVLTGAPPFRLPTASAQVAIGEYAGATLLHLEGDRVKSDIDALLGELGIMALPPRGIGGGNEGTGVACVVPAVWIVVLRERTEASQLDVACAAGRAFEAARHRSYSLAQLTIASGLTTELLSKGGALDLHPRTFPPGACAVAGFVRLRTIFWRSLERVRFDLFAGRSRAVAMWE